MKLLYQIRYLLFAIVLLGLFANFAQNEYGLGIIYISGLFIAFIFLIEAFVFFSKNYSSSKLRSFYLFFEHLFIAFAFIGFYFRYAHLNGAGAIIALSFGLIIIQYLIFGIYNLVKNFKKGSLLSVLVFLFFINIIIISASFPFKALHWPGGNLLLFSSMGLFLILLFISIIKRTYNFNGEKITFKKRLLLLPGKPVMVFCYFFFWVVYFSLVNIGIAPGFYSLSRPVAVEKLLEQKQEERAGIYMENYENFLNNRAEANNK